MDKSAGAFEHPIEAEAKQMRHNTLDSAMGGGKSHYIIVFIIILVLSFGPSRKGAMTQIYKIFYTYSTFGIFLPPENATQESSPMQVESHPRKLFSGLDTLADLCQSSSMICSGSQMELIISMDSTTP